MICQPLQDGSIQCPDLPADVFGLSSVDAELLQFMLGAGFLFWSVGLGLGLLIAMIRKTRM